MWVLSVGFGFLIAALVPNVAPFATKFFTPHLAIAASGFLSAIVGIACAAAFVSTSRLSERLPAAIPGYELLLTGAIVRALMLVTISAGALLFPERSGLSNVFNTIFVWISMPLGLIANILLLIGSTKVLLAALPRVPRAAPQLATRSASTGEQ